MKHYITVFTMDLCSEATIDVFKCIVRCTECLL